MKFFNSFFVAASGKKEKILYYIKYYIKEFYCLSKYNLAGIVSYEKPVTPRTRGHSYCIGCDAATNGQFPWQGTASKIILENRP